MAFAFAATVFLAAAESAKNEFNLPADAADRSLKAFAAQSGLEVLYVPEATENVRTNAVRGTYTPREAIDRLLRGTNLVVSENEKTGALKVLRVDSPNAQRAAQATRSDRPKNQDSRANSEQAAKPEDTPVELSPFVTNADRDVGYVANSSLAGSRLNTSLKDTAASLSVMTAEFLSDIGATNLSEALEWGNNVQESLSDDPGGSADGNPNAFFGTSREYRVRGVQATITRNYFEWSLPIDIYNIDRIEEARGPNSILFGIGSAGGLVNSSTKQAVTGRAFRHASATVGSFGGYRGTIDLNQSAFDGKLGVRLNAVYDHAGSYLTYGFSHKRRVHLALKYELSPTTRFRAEYETGDNHDLLTAYPLSWGSRQWIEAGRPTFATQVAANTALGMGRYGAAAHVTYIGNSNTVVNLANQNFGTGTTRLILDPAVADLNINYGGPGQIRDSHFNAFSAFAERRFGRNTYLELAYNHQDADSRAHQAFGESERLSFDPNRTLPNGAPNPFAGRLMIEGTTVRRLNRSRSDDTRLTLSTEHDFGKWGHYRISGMAEYESRVTRDGPQFEVWAGAPFNALPENAANNVYRRNYVTEGNWSTYYRNMAPETGLVQNLTDPVTGRTLSSTWVAQNQGQQDDPNYQTTLLFGGQARYFNNRLVLGIGFRKDKLNVTDRASRRNPTTSEFEVDYVNATELSYNGRTSTLGVVAHVTRHISLLYNRADNFSLPNLNLRMLPDSLPRGNPVGKGEDMGLNVALLDGKLHARAVYYKSGTVGAQGPHGFGGTGVSATSLTQRVVDALVGEGLISAAEGDQHRVTANGIVFDQTSEGYEVSLTANPTRDWRLQANYSYTTSFEENIGVEVKEWAGTELAYFRRFPQTLPSVGGTIGQAIAQFEDNMIEQFALAGEDVRANRKHKVNLFTRYTFSSGPLKGAFIGGGYRHQSKNPAGRTVQGVIIHGRSTWLADALLGYRFPRVPVLKRLNLQLNVSNVFDDDRPLETYFFDDGSVRRLVRTAPRTWRLSAGVEY
ncbi:MAG: TonB-dependent receptor [Opitutaceae bacterium]|nr:TonB-dependent receptor [Opitutaceae bacterium]